jgi:glycerol-3-phosphate dehydrogenase
VDSFDLLVVGGGINGTAIARDAAGRGLSVLLVEKDDLASHTSSASSKLAHGGLRYLEQREFGFVRESLREREILLRTAPHIVRPLRFILPDPPGGRPWWLIRAGLLLYDILAGRGSLPRSRGVGRRDTAVRAPLKERGFRLVAYWDAWVDDARLTVLNAVDAAERGAEIATRTEFLSGEVEDGVWRAELSGGRTVFAAAIVNASGAHVADVLESRLGARNECAVRLVRGSHIVVPRLWEGDHAYILQQPDGRVVFALPYGQHSLIGTTDVTVDRPDDAQASEEEIAYLIAAANDYFARPIASSDIVWSYAGVRALYDDGAAQAKDVTRDHRLEFEDRGGAKLLSVIGGKITTARALATEVLDRLDAKGLKFTATSPLPGGDIVPAFNHYLDRLATWVPRPMLARMAHAYGTRLRDVLDGAQGIAALGRHFGGGLYEAEVRYLKDKEFARTADDILWRRTKLGLALDDAERRALEAHMAG